ncbi:hypothetical protein GYMLUDRAFT_35972 [Collybiopsis luxurians FD-317 M1]|nr:hypothetical protein GYMLUDRAFT_35972 [Collybiopsis luxurians FD-317 M1]
MAPATPMLRFSQSSKDYHNTEFTLDSDGRVAVKVRTELPLKEFTANTTVIEMVLMEEMSRPIMVDEPATQLRTKSGEGPITHHQRVERVGEIDFYTYSEREPKVRLRGTEGEREVSEYLERNGTGKKRKFNASHTGCAYTWADFRLRLDDKREVGRYHPRKSRGLFGAKHPAYVELEREQITDIGEIILTLVCMLHELNRHAHLYV